MERAHLSITAGALGAVAAIAFFAVGGDGDTRKSDATRFTSQGALLDSIELAGARYSSAQGLGDSIEVAGGDGIVRTVTAPISAVSTSVLTIPDVVDIEGFVDAQQAVVRLHNLSARPLEYETTATGRATINQDASVDIRLERGQPTTIQLTAASQKHSLTFSAFRKAPAFQLVGQALSG